MNEEGIKIARKYDKEACIVDNDFFGYVIKSSIKPDEFTTRDKNIMHSLGFNANCAEWFSFK